MRQLRWSAWWLALGGLLVAAVVWLSLAGPGGLVGELASSDKLGHFIAYATLALWFAGVVRRAGHAVLVIALILLGAGLESLQHLMPGRSPDALDLAANSAGALAGLALAWCGLDGWCQWLEGRLPGGD